MSLNEELFLFNRTQGMEIILAEIPYKKVQKWENKPPNLCTNLCELKTNINSLGKLGRNQSLVKLQENLECDKSVT